MARQSVAIYALIVMYHLYTYTKYIQFSGEENILKIMQININF